MKRQIIDNISMFHAACCATLMLYFALSSLQRHLPPRAHRGRRRCRCRDVVAAAPASPACAMMPAHQL